MCEASLSARVCVWSIFECFYKRHIVCLLLCRCRCCSSLVPGNVATSSHFIYRQWNFNWVNMSCKCDADWACSCESVNRRIRGTKEGGTTWDNVAARSRMIYAVHATKLRQSNWFPLEDTLVICIDHLSINIRVLSRTVELAAMPHASSSGPQKAPSDIWECANLVFHWPKPHQHAADKASECLSTRIPEYPNAWILE